MSIKYVHTNIIASDWKKLAKFYIDVFGCKPQYPERDLSGEWIDRMTDIDNVRVRGIHLSLPGCDNGPTLEIFEYDPIMLKSGDSKINTQGFGHIAFHVEEVEEVLEKLVQNGGKKLGEVIKKDYGEIGLLKAVYTRDPEGNIVEIMNWSKLR